MSKECRDRTLNKIVCCVLGVEANCIESARGIEYYMVINFKA